MKHWRAGREELNPLLFFTRGVQEPSHLFAGAIFLRLLSGHDNALPAARLAEPVFVGRFFCDESVAAGASGHGVFFFAIEAIIALL